MKSNPALLGGLLKSKPTRSNTFGCSATSAFFVLGDKRHSESTSDVLAYGGETMELPTVADAHKAQEELEQRVADRTATLAKNNRRLRHEIKEGKTGRTDDSEGTPIPPVFAGTTGSGSSVDFL